LGGIEGWIKRQGEVTKTVISIGAGLIGVAWYVHREVRESGAVLETRFNQQFANTEHRLERKVSDSEQRLERKLVDNEQRLERRISEVKDDVKNLARDITDIKLMFMAQQQRLQSSVTSDRENLSKAPDKV